MREDAFDFIDDRAGLNQSTQNETIEDEQYNSGEFDGFGHQEQDFWVLWQRIQPKLMVRCLGWLNGNKEDAEDALHDCMLKAYHWIKDGSNNIRNVEAWLTRLVYNHCVDMYRNRKNTPVKEQDPWFWEKNEKGNKIARPDRHLIYTEETRLLLLFIAELPAKLRIPFVLHFLEDQAYTVIAKECGLTIGNVRKRIQLARAEIKSKLAAVNNNRMEPPKPSETQLVALNSPKAMLKKVVDPVHLDTVRMTSVKFPKGIIFYAHLFHGDSGADLSLEKERRLEKYVAKHPGGWKKRLELGQILELKGDWSKAISHYQMVLSKRPDQIAVSWHLAHLLKLTGFGSSAGAVLKAAAQHVSPLEHRLVFQGWGAYLQGHSVTGEKLLRLAVDKEPELSFCSYALGLFLFWEGRNEEALACLMNTVKYAPRHLPALSLLIEILKIQGRRDLLSFYLDTVLAIQPDHVPTLKYRLDESWEENGISHKTLKQLDHLSKLAPGSIVYLESLCTYHRIRGEADAVIELWEHFVDKNPRHPGGWFRLAREQFRHGKRNGAFHSLKKAGELVRLAIGNHFSHPRNERELDMALKKSPLLPQSIHFS